MDVSETDKEESCGESKGVLSELTLEDSNRT